MKPLITEPTDQYQFQYPIQLYFYHAYSFLEVEVDNLALTYEECNLIALRLTLQGYLDLYQCVDRDSFFNFKSAFCTPFTNSNLQSDRPIQLELTLKLDLLPHLLEHASTTEEAASYLMQLSQEQKAKGENEEIDPLLLAKNWFALSVTQTLESGETIGYRTLWSYLPPSALADGIADPDQVTDDAFSNFFKELTDVFSDEDERKPRTPVFDALINFFQKDDWSFLRIQGEPALRLAFAGQNGQWNCYARAREDQRQILFYSICPISIPEDKRSSIAEFLTRANYGMILGNFELDFSDGEVRYKTSLNSANSIPSQSAIQQLVYTNLMIMDEYLPGIQAIVETGQAPQEAIQAIEEKVVPEAASA